MRCPLGAAIRNVLFLWTVFGAAAWLPACDCVVVPRSVPEMEYFLKQATIILGTIREVAPLDPAEFAASPGLRPVGRSRATVQVDRYWGGTTVTAVLSIETGYVPTGCGVAWRVGDCYLLDPWFHDGIWEASTCGITTEIGGTRDPMWLLPPDGPVPDNLGWLEANFGPGMVPAQ